MRTNSKVRTAIREYQGQNATFRRACEIANIKPTYRQYRKWEQGRGLAFFHRSAAIQDVHNVA